MSSDHQVIFHATEIATYVVCPEAWRLKKEASGAPRINSLQAEEAKKIRSEWVKSQDLSTELRKFATMAYALLVLIVITVFLMDSKLGNKSSSTFGRKIQSFGFDRQVPDELFFLLLTVGILIAVWDLFDRNSKKLKRSSGLDEHSKMLAVRGSALLPEKEYCSEKAGLSGRPGALVQEAGHIIPTEIHPLGKKIKDRHVIQMMVYLRLVEEIEGKKPPYGILIMGKEQRQVKIKNSDEKQRWLSSVLDEMRSILGGVPTVPAPNYYKCRSCDVRNLCSHSAYTSFAKDKDIGAEDEE